MYDLRCAVHGPAPALGVEHWAHENVTPDYRLLWTTGECYTKNVDYIFQILQKFLNGLTMS